MLICIIDGNNIPDRETLHDILASSLQLPDWYGRNLDALYDCLSDLREETEIRLLHEEALENHLGQYAPALLRVIRGACRENPEIRLIQMPKPENISTEKRYRQMNLNHITVNTQSSIRIEGSKILYFDPFQVKASPHDADIIFITHEHYDHFEPESIARLQKDSSLIAAPESMKKKILSESGLQSGQCLFYTPGKRYEQEGIVIETVPAYNKLKPFHPKMKKWQGYIVTMDGIRYYVAGDTDVNEDIKQVKCDVALIPIGGHYTMNLTQAAEYIAEICPKAVIPTHYGSIVGHEADGQEFEKYLITLNQDIQVELKLHFGA